MKAFGGMFAIALLVSVGHAQDQDPRSATTLFKEGPLCKFEGAVKLLEETLRVSDDMTRVAVVVKKRDKHYVGVNGKLGRPYPEIFVPKNISPRETIRFSPDWTRIGYAARVDKGFVINVDDKESELFEMVLEGMPLFSPDSRHFGFAGIRKGKIHVVVDTNVSKPLDDLQVGSVAWSPDGANMAYCARDGNKWFVYCGKNQYDAQQGVSDNGLKFSPDSAHVAYAATIKGKWYMMMDGKAVVVAGDGRPVAYDAIAMNMPVWSEDSKRLAFAAQRSGSWFIVVDGKEIGPFNAVAEGTPVFSKNAKEIAYAVLRGKTWTVYRHEKATDKGVKELAAGDAVLAGTPVFSENGATLVYAVNQGGAWKVYPNAVAQAPVPPGQTPPAFPVYAAIKEGTLRVTPDGGKVVFVARKGDRWVVVLNGKELPNLYEDIGSVRVSRGEGSSTVAISAKRRGAWVVVVNGDELYRWYYEFLQEALVVSRDGKRVSYYARGGKTWSMWLDGIPQPCNIPYSYRFNPDTGLIEGVTWDKKAGPIFNSIRESPR